MMLFFVTAAHSADWPQWRGPNRDGISTERDWLVNWPPIDESGVAAKPDDLRLSVGLGWSF